MNGWRLRLFVGVERLLARLGLKLPGKIMYIGGSDTLPPPLSRDEEAELIARLDGGDEGVKSQLIERNLRLVVYIARRPHQGHQYLSARKKHQAGHLRLPVH